VKGMEEPLRISSDQHLSRWAWVCIWGRYVWNLAHTHGDNCSSINSKIYLDRRLVWALMSCAYYRTFLLGVEDL
jgi:hypothetical protein